MAEYEIVDEPPVSGTGRGRGEWMGPFAAFLHAHPGKWAVAPREWPPGTNHSSSFTYLKKRYGLEVVSRADPETHVIRLYARAPEPDS